MAYSAEVKEKFIELRASSVSLEKTREELGISYNTAVNWNREFREKIATTRSLKREELIEKYRMTKENRIELFGEMLLAMNDELAKRDLSEITTPRLFDMMIKCAKLLEEERQDLGEFEFLTDEDIKRNREARAESRRKFEEMFGASPFG